MSDTGSTRREFVRIQMEIPVRYKFVTKLEDDITVTERLFEGNTHEISAGGFLLHGRIPNMDYLGKLLSKQAVLGVNLEVPSFGMVKGLMRVAWIESFEVGSKKIRMGCNFIELDDDAKDALFKFVIRQQMS